MGTEITTKQEWVCVTLPCGEYYIPASNIDLALVMALTHVTIYEVLPDDIKLLALKKLDDLLLPFLPPHDAILSVEIKKGYGVRLIEGKEGSNWAVYGNKVEAKAGLRDAEEIERLCQQVTLIDKTGD